MHHAEHELRRKRVRVLNKANLCPDLIFCPRMRSTPGARQCIGGYGFAESVLRGVR